MNIKTFTRKPKNYASTGNAFSHLQDAYEFINFYPQDGDAIYRIPDKDAIDITARYVIIKKE
jgi:hypothetical protein